MWSVWISWHLAVFNSSYQTAPVFVLAHLKRVCCEENVLRWVGFLSWSDAEECDSIANLTGLYALSIPQWIRSERRSSKSTDGERRGGGRGTETDRRKPERQIQQETDRKAIRREIRREITKSKRGIQKLITKRAIFISKSFWKYGHNEWATVGGKHLRSLHGNRCTS